MRVFIGGSRSLTSVGPAAVALLKLHMAAGDRFLIGDADGVDRMVQTYLAEKGYRNVTIFCTGKKSRWNVGGWMEQWIVSTAKPNSREWYTAKDEWMTKEADKAVMVWDGMSKGTKANIDRLQGLGIPYLVLSEFDGHGCTIPNQGE